MGQAAEGERTGGRGRPGAVQAAFAAILEGLGRRDFALIHQEGIRDAYESTNTPQSFLMDCH